MSRIKQIIYHPMAIFTYKTAFYLFILLSLLWFYGFKTPNDSGFIYEEF
ncbi:teichoic acid D-Ala incorporation-associated protein DltX [Bacillus massiliigorillae]|nr:teichoic acid D-Ala incorporation-associated protein DltX [Bacillus massiliigorillae]